MPKTNDMQLMDPLGAFMAGWLEMRLGHPMPLVSTDIAVEIASGLAVVETRRLFRNVEHTPIEAVMTFPVPVHAALFGLEARIDGRHVVGQAQRREQARETYEAAVDAGKAAVLHEEVLRGIHTLSAANIRPGGEIEVTLRWVASLSRVAGQGALRIPLTVGDIYGCSGLPDADELTHAAHAPQTAHLRIACADGAVTVGGMPSGEAGWTVPLNRPVDIVAPLPTGNALHGVAADGRRVTLAIAAAPEGESACRLAVLSDCSGSMGDIFGLRPRLTKHQAAVSLLKHVSGELRGGDHLDIWQFDSRPERVGALTQFDRASVEPLLAKMSGPRGGTEIGGALATVTAQPGEADILLITDGQSHALDVHALAATGRRISVLLVGEGSFEARVGYLAALTGGELFIATPSNLVAVAAAMVATMRNPGLAVVPVSGALDTIATRRGGMDMTVQWTEAGKGEAATPWARAVGAFAASLALPSLDEARAGQLSEAEGLVTALTSLVLVDEAGEAVDGLPGMRKVPLESPAYAGAAMAVRSAPAVMDAGRATRSPGAGDVPRGGGVRFMRRMSAPVACASAGSDSGPPSFLSRLETVARAIDWSAGPARLSGADLSTLPAGIAERIRELAGDLDDKAQALGLEPLKLAIGLLAHCASATSRSAGRLARMLLGKCDPDILNPVLREIGLYPLDAAGQT